MRSAHRKSKSRTRSSKRNPTKKGLRRSSRPVRRSTGSKRPTIRAKTGKPLEATYVFECTRQGCGYKIVREEKAELGHIRFDLKCPKCHNREFKCLGRGDLPEAEELEMIVTSPAIDFDNVSPVGLGSN